MLKLLFFLFLLSVLLRPRRRYRWYRRPPLDPFWGGGFYGPYHYGRRPPMGGFGPRGFGPRPPMGGGFGGFGGMGGMGGFGGGSFGRSGGSRGSSTGRRF